MKKHRQRIFAAIAVTAVLFLLSCNRRDGGVPPGAEELKYVFLFIGDGMGFSHIAAAEAFLSAERGDRVGNVSLSFSEFPVLGMATTHSADSYITCSAAAGTALAAGVKTKNGMLGMDPSGKMVRSVAYDLKDAGYKIGIATSVSIDHATPAAFYASVLRRDNYYDIARQIAASRFDFFAGAGLLNPIGVRSGGASAGSTHAAMRSDSMALIGNNPDDTALARVPEGNVYDFIKSAGYAVVRTPGEFKLAPPDTKILMAQEETRRQHALVRAVNRKGNDGWTLTDFTRAGIDRLYNKDGFFFMVEGGMIDWFAHNNDAAATVYEVIDFSNAIEAAVNFYNKHPKETLIIVTADHETGGLSLGNYENPYTLRPRELKRQIQREGGAGEEEMRGRDRRAGFGWTTGGHTGGAVPVFAIGAGSELFAGKMDNTDIPKKIRALTATKDKAKGF